jgi:hypothetical protein
MLNRNVGGQRRVPPTVPQDRAPIPIIEGAGWMPGPGWTCVEDRKFLAATGVRNANRSARGIVAIPTPLLRAA